jgi:hypothetical protein
MESKRTSPNNRHRVKRMTIEAVEARRKQSESQVDAFPAQIVRKVSEQIDQPRRESSPAESRDVSVTSPTQW